MKAFRIAIIILFIFYAITALAAEPVTFTGKVVGVKDGDTIVVLRYHVQNNPDALTVPSAEQVTIRLAGIDCPEKAQAFGQRAKQFTSFLVFDREVTVKIYSKTLTYGRSVGDVILPNGESLSQELLKAGLAWWYRHYSKDEHLGELEAIARREKRGLWADPNPVPPWEFRKGKR